MSDVDVEVVVAENPTEAAADYLVAAARAGGHVALSGGSTPAPAYELAAALEPDWSRVALWWVDDRVVPPDHEHSNYALVRHTLLDRVGVAPREVHRIEGEREPAEAAARYDEALAGVELDLALMGVGSDGHTASLFPHGPELEGGERRAIATEARMEPFVPRVTMTIPFLERARLMVYVVVGGDKAGVVARAFEGEPDPGTPASLVRGGRTVVVLDREAASAFHRL